MKMLEAIVQADKLRDNTIDEETKARWLYDLDCQIAEYMGIKRPEPRTVGEEMPNPYVPYDFDWPNDSELFMPAPHDDIYPLYLVAKIDYYNQDSGLYANDMAVYFTALSEARAWWRRHHEPEFTGPWRVM